MAIRGKDIGVILSFASSEPNRDDFAPVVVAAGVAQVVRTLELAAVLAFGKRVYRQSIVAAAHAPAGRGGFSFGDSHLGTCSCKFVS
jgi:hypothetical protein